MCPLRSGLHPVIVFGRHQHELAPSMPGDLDRLALGLVLKVTELALKFESSCLSHEGTGRQCH
jgi:hypothetical protein